MNPLQFIKRHSALLLILLLFACVPRDQIREAREPAPVVKVLLKKITAPDTLYFHQTFDLKSEEANYEFGRNNNRIIIEPLPDGYKLFNEQRLFLFRPADIVRFVPREEGAWFAFDTKRYNGEIFIQRAGDNSLLLVNVIDLEDYLKSVVPAEIPSSKQIYLEAIKAQAVCARTYALNRIAQRDNKTYHMHADVRDQAYGSLTGRTEWSNQAVDETRGRVLVYKDELAQVYYHSHSGGMLEEDSVLWPGANLTYMMARQDVIGSRLAGAEKPWFRWKQTRTLAQLDSLYKAFRGMGQKPQTVSDTLRLPYAFKVLERSASNRVKKMNVTYGDDSFDLQNYEIRRYLGWPAGRLLPSTLFYLSASDTGLVIHGGGNGHGVGMSQWGAVDKAEKGLLFYHILESYFPGTRLRRLY